MESIYDFTVTDNHGKDFDFSLLKGKVLLIVNTASKCGFTPQYKGLEELYKKHKETGLVVIGFPCDQFAHQEPGDDAEIASFCQLNYGVTFPLMKKIEVNGDGAAPIYQFLKSKTSGLLGDRIKWNFTKFLISRDGETILRFSSMKKPESLEKPINEMLK